MGISSSRTASGSSASSLPGFPVQRFGALSDGATDDSVAVQAAIDAAAANGGKVLLPPGTTIAQGLVNKSHVHFEGQGIGASVLKLKNGANQDLITTLGFGSYT